MEWKVIITKDGDRELHLTGLPEGEIKLVMPSESYQRLGHQKVHALMTQWVERQNSNAK